MPSTSLRAATRLAALLLMIARPGGAQTPAPAAPVIADNSFFIEEAYNQEPGVVQHISTLVVSGSSNRDLFYALTQEWPFRGRRHQLSYSVPVTRPAGESSGFGDILLNYRLQLGGEGRWALAPRLSAVLPTGSVRRGLGDGSWGLQANLPFSYTLSRDVVTHWNAGATLLPWAERRFQGQGRLQEGLIHFNLGGSVIAPTRWPVQLMVEGIMSAEEEIIAAGGTRRFSAWTVSPGVRAAFNLGVVQVVPGVAVPVTRANGESSTDLFFYLSLEHPFSTPGAP